MTLAKDLGNLPPNVCTPTYLADQARELAKRYRMKLTVLERADMERLGMRTLLSVAQGSAQPPKLHHPRVPRRAQKRSSRSRSSARASPSTPAASRSSPRPRWTR